MLEIHAARIECVAAGSGVTRCRRTASRSHCQRRTRTASRRVGSSVALNGASTCATDNLPIFASSAVCDVNAGHGSVAGVDHARSDLAALSAASVSSSNARLPSDQGRSANSVTLPTRLAQAPNRYVRRGIGIRCDRRRPDCLDNHDAASSPHSATIRRSIRPRRFDSLAMTNLIIAETSGDGEPAPGRE